MKILIIQTAALGYELVEKYPQYFADLPVTMAPLKTEFPAVTCTAQATFRTALPTPAHGMPANGFFDRGLSKTEFWNQSAHLVEGERIWENARAQGLRTGMLFWQQSLGEKADIILSPAPIHKHSGGMIQDCYSQPRDLFPRLCGKLGRKFKLQHYWGPFTSIKGSEWITEATCEIMRDEQLAPELLFTYLPHLDYSLQRHGPQNREKTEQALAQIKPCWERLFECADRHNYEVVLWGDYAMEPAKQVVYPNLILRRAGWFWDRKVGSRSYPDLYASPAVAAVDHQCALVYVRNPADIESVRQCLEATPGIAEVFQNQEGAHWRGGDLVLKASEGAWFAYPWWEESEKPPDYAGHVDIHNKIGFDPAELMLDRWIPPQVSLKAERIKGTHGRDTRPAAWGGTVEFSSDPETLRELAAGLRAKL